MAGKQVVSDLKQQHQKMAEACKRLADSTGTADGSGLYSQLNQIKSMLTDHLRIEDNQFYPELMKAAEKDATVAGVAKAYMTSMGQISQVVGQFFTKYDSGGAINSQKQKFADDWRQIVAALERRIASEEKSLYPLYEKYCC